MCIIVKRFWPFQTKGTSMSADLLSSTLDGLEDHIAIIDQSGLITYVNKPWLDFGHENNYTKKSSEWLAHNYIHVCERSIESGAPLAAEALQGILDVLNGEKSVFTIEYPCHSPAEERWFRMRIVPIESDSARLFLVSHSNITRVITAEKLSLYDPLTGLANRRYFTTFLENEWRRCYREQTAVGLLMIDVDHFKKYNDQYGHVAGDRCLCAIADIVSSYTRRPGDIAARYGGDEFIVVLGGSSDKECESIAKGIASAVKNMNFQLENDIELTVSIGFISVTPEQNSIDGSIYAVVDKCLYAAKLERGSIVASQLYH